MYDKDSVSSVKLFWLFAGHSVGLSQTQCARVPNSGYYGLICASYYGSNGAGRFQVDLPVLIPDL